MTTQVESPTSGKTMIYKVTIQFNSGPSVEAYEHRGPSTPAEIEEKIKGH